MIKKISSTVLLLAVLVACEEKVEQNKKESLVEGGMTNEVAEILDKAPSFSTEKDGLKIYTAPSQVEYPSAELQLKSPKNESSQAGTVVFDFEVLDYELQEQTNGEKRKVLANSNKGQHIHFIVNNAPYQAKYEPSFKTDLLEGNNVVLAFLSKSFHESVKTKTAFFFDNFYVGEGESFFDKTAPHLFYSRPKGIYKKSKAEKILLDFYLVNTVLAEKGNQVKLKIDEVEFLLPHWSAYFIEGLTVGQHTIRIQLLDEKGVLIDGPFNDSGARTIEIIED